MSDAPAVPGHGPADPPGYCITAVAGGFVWTRRADEVTSEPLGTHEEAVAAAEADRRAGASRGLSGAHPPPGTMGG